MAEHQVVKECVRLPPAATGGSARRVVRCDASGVLVLWAADSMLLYEGGRIRDTPVSVAADFIIEQVLISTSCAVCVDSNGIAHTLPLKFKANTAKPLNMPFKPRAQGLLACASIDRDTAASISRADCLLLCIHRVNVDFKPLKQYKIEILESITHDFKGKVLLHVSKESADNNAIETIFKTKERNLGDDAALVLFSLDCFTLYGQFVSVKDTESSVTPIKLFTCPTEISSLQVVSENGLRIVMALKSGTVIVLNCNSNKLEAKIIHFNSAIQKLLPINANEFMYTDGVKLWKVEDVFTDGGLSFKQLFVTLPKDFIKHDNRILCTTYTNMLYSFSLASDEIFVNQTSTSEGFLSIPRDLRTSKQIVTEIMNEVKKNELILQKIKIENTLMTAVALSKESSLLDRHINFTTHIFDRYEDVLKEYGNLSLTRPLKEYFEPKTVLLLVKLQISSEFRQKFNEITSCLSRNIHLNVAVSNGTHTETTTIPLDNNMQDGSCCLLPVQCDEDSSQIDLSLKIVSPISGAVDASQTFWTILYSKQFTLRSEHFIKADGDSFSNKVIYFQNTEDVEEMVLEISKKKHGLLFDFEVPPKKNRLKEWSCYLKLPKDHQQKFSNVDSYSKTLNAKISQFLAKKFDADFLKGKQTVYITICNIKIAFQITDEEGNNILKISGSKADVVFDLRQFFSGLFYASNEDPELIPQIEYTRVENLRRKLRDLQEDGADEAAISEIAQQFHRYTLGVLPL